MPLSRRTKISLVLVAIGLAPLFVFVAPLTVRHIRAWIEADHRAEEVAQAQLWTQLAPLEKKLFEAASGGPPLSGPTVLSPDAAPAPENSSESSAEQP